MTLKVTIGITTYNRLELLKKTINSLGCSDMSNVICNIKVYDDGSTEYGVKDIKALLGEYSAGSIDIQRNEKNLGADGNMYKMYCDFLNSQDDLLFNCDSDLIFDPDWLNEGLRLILDTDGILSLFNTDRHRTIEERGELCEKESIGNAGTLIKREAVKFIVNNFTDKDAKTGFDLNWCKAYTAAGYKVFASKRSYVQHIGLYGYNCKLDDFVMGKGFSVSNVTNGQALNDLLVEMSENRNLKEHESRKFYYLFPFDKILYGSRIAIYGNGVVGKDYAEQVMSLDFCRKVTIIDRNHDDSEIMSPDILKIKEFDYIIIANALPAVRDEIENEIVKKNAALTDKVVNVPCRSIRL